LDNDITHATEARLVAIESRLDALDGGPDEEGDGEEESTEPSETVTPSYSGRSRSRSRATTTVGEDAVSEVSEGSE
jgi:hypothetical protein